jgi:hypothetical protein
MGDRSCGCVVLSALALCCTLLAAARAGADIPPDCGTRASFDAELRKRLGEDVPVETVDVAIVPRGERFHLRVAIEGEVRELDDESCSELLRAAVVVAVAMLLHDEPAAETKPEVTTDDDAPKPTGSARPRFTASAGGGVNVGTLPTPTPVIELEAQALWRYWGVALGARYLAPSKELDQNDRGAKLQGFDAHAAGIFRPSPAWQARLGFGAQRLSGEGEGSLAVQTATVWVAGPTLGLGFVPFEQGGLWLGLGAEGQLNAVRGDFRILNYNRGDDHVVHEVPWLSGSAFVRLGLLW